MEYMSEERRSMSGKLSSVQRLSLDSDTNNVLLNVLINDSDLGITVSDFEGSLHKVNPAFQKMTGYSKKELLSLTTFDIIHPHDFKMEKSLLDELGDGKRYQYAHDKRFITKSGEIIYTFVTSYKLDNPNGQDQILTIIQNLSAHHKVITELKSDQTLFTALLDNSRDRIYYKDLEGRFIKANNAVAKAHNFPSPESLIGKTDFDIFGQEHATESFNDDQEIIRTGKPLIGKEERIEWPDGSVSWVSTSKMPFYDSRGVIKGTIGLTRDITKHKLTEEQLVNERIMMRTLLNNLPDSIYIKDLDCKKTFLNKSDKEVLIKKLKHIIYC